LRAAITMKDDGWVYLALVLVLAVFLVIGLTEAYRTDGLFSYDPYYHMNISRMLESEQNITTEIQYYETSWAPQYQTSMRLLTVLIHQYTGLSLLDVYRIFGLFCRVLAALALFVTAAYFLKDKRYALLAVILFLAAPYIFLRSLIAFPENLALPFQILIFGSVVKGLREKKTDPALPLYISAALYVHYRSFIVPALILLLYLVFRRSIKYTFSLACGTAVLSAPILTNAIDQYVAYFHTNVGPSAAWKPYAVGAAYSRPSLDSYIGQLGVLLVLFTLLGIPFLLRKMDKVKFILLAWLGLTFFLSLGKTVGVYVPTDRMLVYLSVPAALTSAFFLKEFLEAKPLSPRLRAAAGFLIALAMVFMLTVNLPAVHGWTGIRKDMRDAAVWLDENVPDDGVILSTGMELVTMGVQKTGRIGYILEDWKKVLASPQGVRNRLDEDFPGKDIYIVVATGGIRIHDAAQVFSQGQVRIYRYDAER
jgi:asparagine N-glycosylation enzyme membrane subunit Stt3